MDNDAQAKDFPSYGPLSGTAIRDRSWRLINAANLDYAPKFIGEPWSAAKADSMPAVDGLIRTPMGYYRLAEDMRDGTHVLLHSYEIDQLTGVRDGNRVRLADMPAGDYDIYGVTARDVHGSLFRDDMLHDIRVMERAFQKDLNLHMQDLTPASISTYNRNKK